MKRDPTNAALVFVAGLLIALSALFLAHEAASQTIPAAVAAQRVDMVPARFDPQSKITQATAAGARPVPKEQWTPEAKLWLSRALVGEGGWLSKRDHAGIAWALANRWQARHELSPEVSFVEHVRVYCASVGYKRPTKRQRWVRALPKEANTQSPPLGWPSHVSWANHVAWWRSVQRWAHAWGRGEVPDPTGGRVEHFGARDPRLVDPARARRAVQRGVWYPIVIAGASSAFYGVHGR